MPYAIRNANSVILNSVIVNNVLYGAVDAKNVVRDAT